MNGSKLPFWLHQAAEYLIGLAVLLASARQREPAAGMSAGAVVLVLASIGDGPLAAFRKVPRTVHRIADIGVVVAFIATAVLARSWAGAGGSPVLVGVAVVIAGLVWRTDYRPRGPRRPLRDRLPTVDSDKVGRSAGRAVGTAAAAGRRWWRSRQP